MGYSRSRKTLDKMLPLLDKLKAGEGTQWHLAQGVEPERFAYKIREALHVASLFPDIYPELAAAANNFKIEIVDRLTVQAVYRPAVLGLNNSGESAGVTVHGLESGDRGRVTHAGEQTAMSVIQAWHNNQPSNTPMNFPQACLERDDLLKLHTWASKRTPPWIMLVSMEGALTLTPFRKDLEGLGWDPSDED